MRLNICDNIYIVHMSPSQIEKFLRGTHGEGTLKAERVEVFRREEAKQHDL